MKKSCDWCYTLEFEPHRSWYINAEIKWVEVLNNAEKQAKEDFGRPEIIFADTQASWDLLRKLHEEKD